MNLDVDATLAELHREKERLDREIARLEGHQPPVALDLDVAAELQKIYDSKINVHISWFWDNGIDVK